MTCLDTPFFQIQPQERYRPGCCPKHFDAQVTYTWPHVHWIENLMTISATLALPGGTAFYLYGNEVRMWVASCVRSNFGQSCSSLTVRTQMSPLPTRAIGLFDVRCVYSCGSYRLDDFIIPNHPMFFVFWTS